jgi:hypothetical protein
MGNRFPRNKPHASPPPGNYKVPSDFDACNDSSDKKGYSFGSSRDAYKKVYMKHAPKVGQSFVPGPGNYDVKTFID